MVKGSAAMDLFSAIMGKNLYLLVVSDYNNSFYYEKFVLEKFN